MKVRAGVNSKNFVCFCFISFVEPIMDVMVYMDLSIAMQVLITRSQARNSKKS